MNTALLMAAIATTTGLGTFALYAAGLMLIAHTNQENP